MKIFLFIFFYIVLGIITLVIFNIILKLQKKKYNNTYNKEFDDEEIILIVCFWPFMIFVAFLYLIYFLIIKISILILKLTDKILLFFIKVINAKK